MIYENNDTAQNGVKAIFRYGAGLWIDHFDSSFRVQYNSKSFAP